MGLVALAIGDVAITFLWVLYIAFMKIAAILIAAALDLHGYEFHLIMGLLAVNVFLFSRLGGLMGGAMWNPTMCLAFSLVGAGKNSLFPLAVRIPAQTTGAIGGVLAAKELWPQSFKHLLRGPELLVDLQKGTLAESVLTFLITFSVLLAIFKGPNSPFLKTWLIILATYVVVILGAGYTGPGMNPAHAFAWAYVNDRHNTMEHLLVYWLAPLTGAAIAAWLFQVLYSPKRPKEKAA